MEEWQTVVFIMGGILLATIYLLWIAGILIDAYIESKKINEYSKDFETSIQHSQPSWEEMKEIIRTHNLQQSKVLHIYQKAMKKILTGESKELEPYKELIRSYIDKYNEEEPFEGMPSDIRIHLERLREQINDDRANLLDPLTNQIKDLLSINERERKHQKYYTIGGFFVGIIGLIFAIYSLYITPVGDNVPTQKVSHEKVEKK